MERNIGTATLASSSINSFELGNTDTLSAAASKLLPPSPVEDNADEFATSSYHDNSNNDKAPGFELHTEEEEENTVVALPVG
eukprot:3458847-Ditylum_brightwellii.AAC.1